MNLIDENFGDKQYYFLDDILDNLDGKDIIYFLMEYTKYDQFLITNNTLLKSKAKKLEIIQDYFKF